MKVKKKKLKHPPYSRFKAFLIEHNIKLKEIAGLIGVSVTSISLKNNGFSDYSMDQVNHICDQYNITTELFRTKKVE